MLCKKLNDINAIFLAKTPESIFSAGQGECMPQLQKILPDGKLKPGGK